MNILFYLIGFLPIICLLGTGYALIPICESYDDPLKQACFKDIGFLPIYGLIISVIMVFTIYYFHGGKPKTQSFTKGVNQ